MTIITIPFTVAVVSVVAIFDVILGKQCSFSVTHSEFYLQGFGYDYGFDWQIIEYQPSHQGCLIYYSFVCDLVVTSGDLGGLAGRSSYSLQLEVLQVTLHCEEETQQSASRSTLIGSLEADFHLQHFLLGFYFLDFDSVSYDSDLQAY